MVSRLRPAHAVLTVLLIALFGSLIPTSAFAATGTIHGAVTDAAGGGAVSQYTVELYSAAMSKVDAECTDGTGQYVFNGLATATYYVQFSGDPTQCTRTGFAPLWYQNRGLAKFADPVAVTDAEDRPGIDASLMPEATLSGTVTDANGLAGVQHVTVRVLDSDGNEAGRACSAADGTYTVHRLLPLPYVVQFVSDGSCGAVPAYPTRYYRMAAPEGAATAAGATSVSSDYGKDLGGIDVRLSFNQPQAQQTLTVVVTGTGSVTSSPAGIACPGTCSAMLPAGTVVTLTPTAQAGSVFAGWSGACSGSGGCSMTLDADKSTGAMFAVVGGSSPTPTPTGGATPTATATASATSTPGLAPTAVGSPSASAGPAPDPTVTPAAAKASCTIASRSKVRGKRFTATVRCNTRATLVLRGTASFKRGHRTHRVNLARTTATATGTTVSIRLPAKVARALKAKRRVLVSLTLEASTSAGTTKFTARKRRLKTVS